MGAAAAASGCVLPGQVRGIAGLPMDARSQEAKDVLEHSRHPGPYPKFADIPPVPTDVRPPEAWRAAVLDLKGRKAQLDADAAALPPPAQDTEAYAAETRPRLPSNVDAPPPETPQQTEAYARALRERATPPPRPK